MRSLNIDGKCTCINETLNCNQGSLAYYNNDVLQHSNIQIRNKNFTAKIVNFQFNKFTFLKKNEILSGHESKVEELDFYYNDIATIENGTFDKFLSLKKLDFEFNSLTFIDERILTKQLGSTLKELNFYGNDIQNLSINTFQYCTKLTSLNFQHNERINLVAKINGINVTVFPEALENLKYLNLASCKLKEFDENVFINLRSLKTLILSDNLFTSIPKAIKMLPTLQHLDIRSSLIRSINDCDFCNLSNLKTIFLSDSPALTYIDENAFGALNNHSTTLPPPKLNDLSLHNCNIHVLPEKLLDWKNISLIDISNNPLSCNCSMAWLINDINATSPLCANSLKNYLGTSYKNKLVCHYPNVLYGTHLYKISGDFCSNGTFDLEEIVKKRDEIYYACEDDYGRTK
uniref:Uncharacterized protein n=1 Tax=Panagrolaimus davidi TaxID=227884 RepID=A0A914P1K5_9BILA